MTAAPVRIARVRSTGVDVPVLICSRRVSDASAIMAAMMRAGWDVIGHPSAWRYCKPRNGKPGRMRDYTRLDVGAAVVLDDAGAAVTVLPAEYFYAHYRIVQ